MSCVEQEIKVHRDPAGNQTWDLLNTSQTLLVSYRRATGPLEETSLVMTARLGASADFFLSLTVKQTALA